MGTRKQLRKPRGPAWGKLSTMALVFLAFALAWRYTPLADFLTMERMRAWARVVRETPWAPVAIILAYTPAAVVMFPRPLLTLVAVVAFGAWLGVAYAAAGIMVAALATYCAGRFIPYERVRHMTGEKMDSVSKVLRQHGVIAIFALNQVPAPPFVLQGVIAGACRVNVWHYAVGSLLGMAPALLAWTVFGREIARLIQEPSEISWWILAAVVVVLLVFTFLVRKWFESASRE
jgi:phospholipase D1/2